MATTIDYADREIRTILERIQSNIRTDLPGVNDFFESNEGRFLLDQMGGIAEMLGFTIDRQGAECFIDTVETRPNLIGLLKLIAFQPQNPTPERVLALLRRGGATDTSQNVARYTTMLSNSGIPFSTESDVTFDVDQSEVTVSALQGYWVPVDYVSNGAPYQMVTLTAFGIAEGMIRVAVENVPWQLAANNTFVGHLSKDTRFRYSNLADRRVRVEFGNGGEGFIPPRGAAVKIYYFLTLGKEGHIDAHQLASVNAPGGLTPDNDEPSAGGAPFETIASAKRRYPAAFKPIRRAVTLLDWEALALLVPGVMQSKAVDRNIDPTLHFMKLRLYVIGHGGLVSQALNNAVRDYMSVRRVNALLFDVVSPVPRDAIVSVLLYIYRTHSPAEVKASVVEAVQDFFMMTSDDESEVKLGGSVELSRLTAAIQRVSGVAYFNLPSPSSSIVPKANEFVKLKSLSVEVVGSV